MPELASLIGRSLGSYRVLSLLGSGGMGAVYLAEHRAIGHKAAIKVLRRELAADEETAQRFFNEARAVNLVKHSGIVQIFDYGQEAGVGAYLVMELLEGQSLGDRLREVGAMAAKEGVSIVCRVASALGAAHKRGLIHRDLKPDNVFLVRDDDPSREPRVKVLDFGIAKLADHKTSGVKTKTGLIVGTPQYMAPEYIHGSKAFDHRIDVYSLGIIAYEILSGRLPFTGEGLGEMLVAHMMTAPPPMRFFRPDVPAPLEAVVLRALAKEPDERHETMEAFAEALLAALGDAPDRSPSHRNSLKVDMDSLLGGAPSQVGMAPTMAAQTPAPASLVAAAIQARSSGGIERPASGDAAGSRLATAPTAAHPTGAGAIARLPAGTEPAPSATEPGTAGGGPEVPREPRRGPPSTMTVSAAELQRGVPSEALAGAQRRGTKVLAVAIGAAVALGTVAAVLILAPDAGDDEPDVTAGSGDEEREVAADEDDDDPGKTEPRSRAGKSEAALTAAPPAVATAAPARPSAAPPTPAVAAKGTKAGKVKKGKSGKSAATAKARAAGAAKPAEAATRTAAPGPTSAAPRTAGERALPDE